MKRLKYLKDLIKLKMKYIIPILILIFIIPLALGAYEIGDTITYSVVCLNDSGVRDTGCNTNATKIFNRTDTTGITSYISEVSDVNAPGLWMGTWEITPTFGNGTGSIYIQLTNSNGTASGTVIHFQVIRSGFGAIQTNLSVVQANFSSVLNNITGLQSNVSNISSSIVSVNNTIISVNNTVISINETIKSSNITPAQIWEHPIRTLTSIDLYFLTNWTELQSYIWNASIRLITGGNLTAPDDYKADLSTLANITIDQIDLRINESHGLGLYNATGEVGECPTLDEIDTRINLSHGIGLYNATAACASSEEVQSVNTTVKQNASGIVEIIKAGSNLTADQVWASPTRTLTNGSSIADDIALGVWNWANRVLTGFDFNLFENWTTLQDFVWNATIRELTYYPSVRAVLSLDITQSGLLNMSVFDNVEPQYFFNSTVPTKILGTRTAYYQKAYRLLNIFPANITKVFIRPYLYFAGAPTTDRLEIWVEKINVLNISTANLTTSINQYEWEINKTVITDKWIEIEFKGALDHTPGNEFVVGYGDSVSQLSYSSSDEGITYIKTAYENAVGLQIEYNQSSIAEDLNEETHTPTEAEVSFGCPGQNAIFNVVLRDFSGDPIDPILHGSFCNVTYFENGTGIHLDIIDETINVTKIEKHIYVIWNNTENENTNNVYHIDCEINWSHNEVNHTLEICRNFVFSRECEIEANQSIIISEIKANISAEHLVTRENISSSATGIKENTSEEHTLTRSEIDSLANITVSDIWAHAIREITGGNLSTPDDYKADLSTLANVTAQQIWDYSVRLITGGNLSTPNDYKADLTTLANVTVQQIWEYSIRLITGGNLSNPDDYKADLSTLANVTLAQIDNSLLTVNDTIKAYILSLVNLTGEEIGSYVWNAATRTLTYYNMTDTTNYTLIATPEQVASVNDTVKGEHLLTRAGISSNASATMANVSGEHALTRFEIKSNISAEHILTRSLVDLNTTTIYNYLVTVYNYLNTIYTWLTTDANIVNDAELDAAESAIKANTSAESSLIKANISSEASLIKVNISAEAEKTRTEVPTKVWNYSNISGPRNASQTIADILENTLPGGY